MIIGTGIDIVEIARIRNAWARFGRRFARRIVGEADLPANDTATCQFLAGRFAACEAAVKALGTGFCNGITMSTIHIRKSQSGAPMLNFSGKALDTARKLGVRHCHLSITHERSFAIAMVILEK